MQLNQLKVQGAIKMARRDIFSDYIKKLNNKKNNDDNTEYKVDSSQSADNVEQRLERLERKINEMGNNDYIADSKDIDLALINGNIVYPNEGVIKGNIYIKNGAIHSISFEHNQKAERTLDVSNKYILPGIIDPHVHLGLFSSLEEELKSETRSALLGGVTTIGCYFSGEESYLETMPDVFSNVNRHSVVDVIPHLVINNTTQKEEIENYVNKFNISSFKLYMNGIPGMIPDVGDGFIFDVLKKVNNIDKDIIICVHSENRELVRKATEDVKQRLKDTATIKDWTDTHPDMVEEEAVMRISYLAEKAEVPVYLVHISSKKAVEKLREIKPFNKYINVETTSPYLSITKDDLEGYLGKMEPPFRDKKDLEALWDALSNGIVDSVGTDNVTINKKEKEIQKGLWETKPGYPALGTHLPVMLNEGVIKRGLPIEKVIAPMTKKPAELFNVYPQKGSLFPGSDADLVVVDINESKNVKAENLKSRSDFSLYEGQDLQGWPILTIKGGKIVAENGYLTLDSQDQGAILKR